MKIIWCFCIFLCFSFLHGQEVGLDFFIQKAKENTPILSMLRQHPLLERMATMLVLPMADYIPHS